MSNALIEPASKTHLPLLDHDITRLPVIDLLAVFTLSTLEIMRLVVRNLHTGHEERCVGEQVVHLLKGPVLRLGQQAIKEQSVREIADDE